MDDAMILPCGHSFGAAGIQHISRTVSFTRICLGKEDEFALLCLSVEINTLFLCKIRS